MRTEHTPAPWNFEHNQLFGCVINHHNLTTTGISDLIGRTTKTICIITSNQKPTEIECANARLIAAAPELLAALQELQANPNDPRAHRGALDAIAKAKG